MRQARDLGVERDFVVDSAGIQDWHVGEPPNSRSMAVMEKYGLLPYNNVARQIRRQDFVEFDYIFGMDYWNVDDLMALAGSGDTESSARIHLLREFDPKGIGNIDDPYCVSNGIYRERHN